MSVCYSLVELGPKEIPGKNVQLTFLKDSSLCLDVRFSWAEFENFKKVLDMLSFKWIAYGWETPSLDSKRARAMKEPLVRKRWKTIKFSNDYEKLPQNWEGTQAKLIAVYPEKTSFIKNGLTAFWNYDTKIRGKNERYPLDFEDALILVFIHLNTGVPFTTIRRNYQQKFEYYANSIGETFVLQRVKE